MHNLQQTTIEELNIVGSKCMSLEIKLNIKSKMNSSNEETIFQCCLFPNENKAQDR